MGAGPDGEDVVDRRIVWVTLALATLAAAALRLPFLAHQSLWFDEIFTRDIVGAHSAGGIWDQVRSTESTPPLYYLLAKLATDVAGARSTAALRAPAALALIAAVPVAYCAVRRLIGRRAALVAAGFVAVNPLLVSYSTDARSYGLFVLTGLLTVWGFSAALEEGDRRAYAGWAAASLACLWTHYFGVFTVAAEAAILLVLRPDRRRATLAWALVIAAGSAPLLPLLLRQSASEDSAFIAGISLASRLEATIREFGMGPNVPRTWLEAAGLITLAIALALNAPAVVRRPGSRVILALAVVTLGAPLVLGALGIDDRFYVRNVIVAVPLIAALVAPALLRLRALPLAVYLALALLTSLWVATNWRYEQPDWRAAIARAAERDQNIPVLTFGPDSANVAETYLHRAPSGQTELSRRLLVIIEPYRGPGDRALVPNPISSVVTMELAGFTPDTTTIVHGFRLILVQAPQPRPIASAAIPGTVLFPPEPDVP